MGKKIKTQLKQVYQHYLFSCSIFNKRVDLYLKSYILFPSPDSFCGDKVQTQGLKHARQLLYQWATSLGSSAPYPSLSTSYLLLLLSLRIPSFQLCCLYMGVGTFPGVWAAYQMQSPLRSGTSLIDKITLLTTNYRIPNLGGK
jgi:hypothetical protein